MANRSNELTPEEAALQKRFFAAMATGRRFACFMWRTAALLGTVVIAVSAAAAAAQDLYHRVGGWFWR